MSAAPEFESRIAALDVSLFDGVESQSTVKDRRSWLALQRAVREAKESFVYLEIGSYLGGSLQQYLQDPKCRRIYSIDNRTRDERHADNSEQAMVDNLRRVAPQEMDKLTCFATDARSVPPAAIGDHPDICLVDGEHTREAVLRDFCLGLAVCADDAVIAFHDAGATRTGIAACTQHLRRTGRLFVAYKLPGETFAIALWGSPAACDPRIRRMAVALHGERWLRTARFSNELRRRIPPALRPAFSGLRDRTWGARRTCHC